MYDRVGDFAERVATTVSRRAFLGRLGESALGLAAVIGGVLALPANARAANGKTCCKYVYISIAGGSASSCYVCIAGPDPCPDVLTTRCAGAVFSNSYPVQGCSQCR